MFFSYIDEGLVTVMVSVHAQYNEVYAKDGSEFISFNTAHSCSYDTIAAWHPELILVANYQVKYYNSAGSLLDTGYSNRTYSKKYGSLPSYSTTDVSGMFEGSGMLKIHKYQTNYTY